MIKKNKKSVLKISYLIVLLLISIVALVWYSKILKDELSILTRNTLKEVSSQNALVIQKEIASDVNALTEIADRIGNSENIKEGEIVDTLKQIAYRYPFKTMGYCGMDGMAHATDGMTVDISERSYFLNAIQGETCISEPLNDLVSGEEIIAFSAPVKRGDEVVGVVFATYSVESLREILAVTSFEGEGYTYIVESDGDKVVDSINPTSFQDMTNIYVSMRAADRRNSKAIEGLKHYLDTGETGYVIFYNKVGKYMYSTPLGINDWYLIDVVPVDFLEKTSNAIIQRTYLVCAVLIVVCTFIAAWLYLEERRKKKQMQTLLFVDDLTGGNTYAKFKQEVEQRLNVHYGRTAFIMMDLDEFKLVNELFGYDTGNKVLCHVWNVLNENCGEDEYAGRDIADRFSMLLYFEKRSDIEKRILKMTEAIQKFSIPNASEYILHPVFGIYYVESNDEDVESMMNCASLAHNQAKQERDSIYRAYTNIMKDRMLEKKQLSDQIEHAYKNHEFVVYYQPKYEAETRKLAGAEALVRWRRQDGQMVSPGLFVPLAEESGFVCKLDKYVFNEVCLAQKRWMEKGLKVVPISVNLSRRHLDTPEFIGEYKSMLDHSGVPIKYLQLEITESAMFEKKAEFLEIIESLHKMGFVILMDDFGTGYSSLMMLKSIPIDVMKLDKTFVDDFDDERGEQIIRCVMRMAQDLCISITAEGVETEEQYKFLKSIGCDMIQGYYFARPMPEEEFEKCMEEA